MSVFSESVVALDAASVTGWRRELAESLAKSMDASPNASTARELRALMVELVGDGVVKKGDVSDDLASRRAERRKAASS